MATLDIAALRREYRDVSLDESDVQPDPVEQFRLWFEQAVEVQVRDPSAMTLVTADAKRQPSGRIVLLKGYDQDGFVFYTSYAGQKARDLEENPKGAMVFWWTELDRQVRLQGRVAQASYEEARRYFATRPRGSQISALISPQSRVVERREVLLDAYARAEKEYEGLEIPCPENWGGYRLIPHSFEFWQGRLNRLHDRIRYRMDEEEAWVIERLAP